MPASEGGHLPFPQSQGPVCLFQKGRFPCHSLPGDCEHLRFQPQDIAQSHSGDLLVGSCMIYLMTFYNAVVKNTRVRRTQSWRHRSLLREPPSGMADLPRASCVFLYPATPGSVPPPLSQESTQEHAVTEGPVTKDVLFFFPEEFAYFN